LHVNVIDVSERDFLKECIKKILIKNKYTINNLYPYIWSHHRHLFHSKNICPLLFLTSR
jgi:hypothetical protein